MKKWFLIANILLLLVVVGWCFYSYYAQKHLLTSDKRQMTADHKNNDHMANEKPLTTPTAKAEDSMPLNAQKDADSVFYLYESNNDMQIKKWRQPSPLFKDFDSYVNKSILNQSEQHEFYKLLSNRSLIEKSSEILLQEEKGNLDYNQERERLDSVLYLTTIISNADNNKISEHIVNEAIDVMLKVIESPNMNIDQSEELQKSLIGDKVELGMTIALNRQEIWQDFKNRISDETIRKIVSYIDTHYQHRTINKSLNS